MNARAKDAKETTAARTSEGPDLNKAVRGPPTQDHRDTTPNIEREPPGAYGSMPRGPPGGEEGKGRRGGGQERPGEEDYCRRRPGGRMADDPRSRGAGGSLDSSQRRTRGHLPAPPPPGLETIKGSTTTRRGKTHPGAVTIVGGETPPGLGERQGPDHPGAEAIRSKICQGQECSGAGAIRQEQAPCSLTTRGGPGEDTRPRPLQQPHRTRGHDRQYPDGAPGKGHGRDPTSGGHAVIHRELQYGFQFRSPRTNQAAP